MNEVSDELVGIGADLNPGTLITAYQSGVFPMPLPEELRSQLDGITPLGWWSPNPRGILPLDALRVSRSLRQSARRYKVTVDVAFEDVMVECGNPQREHGWIDQDIIDAYCALHMLGHAHSVEVWDPTDETLAGGLYGVSIAGLFAGESMFHVKRDASKVALIALVDILRNLGFVLLDTQWQTEHLASLGVIEVSRDEYKQLLAKALQVVTGPLGPLEQPWVFK